ncbi:uncharacterized protein TM35_000271370 [Trypanosoma theileri]|uniref:Uncharacterized protein n=1 Tax=Trypanosoma theileri TaxID=67003 RepID=A0A1X0NPC9_9TRYP|nr:uncharacterized protein TM35_000271370 [Trypanosoma theileri]ORC86547.1 hypothetical protein TM35_000271370 [Trypanosoma theileri]
MPPLFGVWASGHRAKPRFLPFFRGRPLESEVLLGKGCGGRDRERRAAPGFTSAAVAFSFFYLAGRPPGGGGGFGGAMGYDGFANAPFVGMGSRCRGPALTLIPPNGGKHGAATTAPGRGSNPPNPRFPVFGAAGGPGHNRSPEKANGNRRGGATKNPHFFFAQAGKNRRMGAGGVCGRSLGTPLLLRKEKKKGGRPCAPWGFPEPSYALGSCLPH